MGQMERITYLLPLRGNLKPQHSALVQGVQTPAVQQTDRHTEHIGAVKVASGPWL